MYFMLSNSNIYIHSEEDMIPYLTVQSGTCESEGMKTIRNKKDCTTILNALKKIGFASIYDDGDIRNWRYDKPLTPDQIRDRLND